MLPNGHVIISNHSTFRILRLPLPGWEPPGERGPDWLPGLSRMHLHEVNVVVLFCPPVSSPIQQGRPALIQLRPESPEELRERLRQMSDLELRFRATSTETIGSQDEPRRDGTTRHRT
jgi:hypothetical protein